MELVEIDNFFDDLVVSSFCKNNLSMVQDEFRNLSVFGKFSPSHREIKYPLMMNFDNKNGELKFVGNKRKILVYSEDQIWEWNPNEQSRFKKIGCFPQNLQVQSYHLLKSFEIFISKDFSLLNSKASILDMGDGQYSC